MKRVPKEWTEVCRECKGRGHVAKRERFALYTEEEQIALLGHLGAAELVDIPEGAERCWAGGGALIDEACKEAVVLAKEMNKAVAFEFNGKTVVAWPASDAERLSRAWWKDMYGETPEESHAKR